MTSISSTPFEDDKNLPYCQISWVSNNTTTVKIEKTHKVMYYSKQWVGKTNSAAAKDCECAHVTQSLVSIILV